MTPLNTGVYDHCLDDPIRRENDSSCRDEIFSGSMGVLAVLGVEVELKVEDEAVFVVLSCTTPDSGT